MCNDFQALIGQLLRMGSRMVPIAAVHRMPQLDTHRVYLALSVATGRPEREETIIVLVDDEREAGWIATELAKRQLEGGGCYDLSADPLVGP